MSRKHYRAIAAIIDQARSEHGAEPVLVDVALELASFFARDNAEFSRVRFLEACGL